MCIRLEAERDALAEERDCVRELERKNLLDHVRRVQKLEIELAAERVALKQSAAMSGLKCCVYCGEYDLPIGSCHCGAR